MVPLSPGEVGVAIVFVTILLVEGTFFYLATKS